MMLLKIALMIAVVCSVKGHLRVCYYSNSAQYRPVPARITPSRIDPNLCTHIIYAFAQLNENSEIKFTEPRDGELVKELTDLKTRNPSLKTLLAVGGYNQGSTTFSDLAANRNLRTNFAKQAIQFLNEWGFDGLDLNWEYPGGRGGRRSADKKNYILLIQELRRQFNGEYYKLMLTVAIPPLKVLLQKGFNLEEMARDLDFISLMAYDFHGDWERTASHNSPLYQRNSENTANQEKNVNWAANYVVSQNVPKDKLVIGLPAYGRSYRLARKNEKYIGAKIRGAGPRQPYTNEYGFMAYNEVCELISDGERVYEPELKVPFLLHKGHWIGYDDEKSFELKLNYVKENGFAGAMVWSIDMDDFDGLCPDFTQTFPLVRKMKDLLNDDIADTQKVDQYDDQYDYQYDDHYSDQYEYYENDNDVVNQRVNQREYKRVCYVASWARFRKGEGRFIAAGMDPFLCTHIIVIYAKLNAKLELDYYLERDQTMFDDVNRLKNRNPTLKTLISLGGRLAKSRMYSRLASYKSKRENFARKAAATVREWGFDGLDLDWRYPAKKGGKSSDYVNYIELLKGLRSEFETTNLLLTAPVPAGEWNIKVFDVENMAKYVDFVNLMTFNLHGHWDGYVGHNSPLYGREGEKWKQVQLNVAWVANYWFEKGMPKDKLIIGLPMFARTFKLSDRNNYQMGDANLGAGNAGPILKQSGLLAAYEVCKELKKGIESKWQEEQHVPFLVDGDQWIGYENERSLSAKLNFIKDNEYGGAMVWTLDMADFNGKCLPSKQSFPFVGLIKDELGENQDEMEAKAALENELTSTPEFDGYKRVCYYESWAKYRAEEGLLYLSEIDPNLCTHIIYAYIPMVENELSLDEKELQTISDEFNQLKLQNPDLKSIIATGGWKAGSKIYSEMVATEDTRNLFTSSTTSLLRKWGFDGLSIDWAYPARRGGKKADKDNFLKLLKALRSEFDAEPRLVLTGSVSWAPWNVDNGYDVYGLSLYMDFITLKTYDMNGHWTGKVGHNSPLLPSSSQSGGYERFNVDWGAQYWVAKGFPVRKIVIGLPTYGRCFILSDRNKYQLGDSIKGPCPARLGSNEAGLIAYYEICKLRNEGVRMWDNEQMVPFLLHEDHYITYDDKESFELKLDYIKKEDFGGAMVWAADLDDFCDDCSEGEFPLMTVVKDGLGSDRNKRELYPKNNTSFTRSRLLKLLEKLNTRIFDKDMTMDSAMEQDSLQSEGSYDEVTENVDNTNFESRYVDSDWLNEEDSSSQDAGNGYFRVKQLQNGPGFTRL